MTNRELYRNISRLYLYAVPLVTALLGFMVNGAGYAVYLPLWLINLGLMATAMRLLCTPGLNAEPPEKYRAASGLLLVAPWLFYSVFAGMGAPPATYTDWLSHLFEQQVRYAFLIIGGLLLGCGFFVLKEALARTKGSLLSLLGFWVTGCATILFILNMMYWHSFLPEVFTIAKASSSQNLPEWQRPVQKFFLTVSVTEVSLTYLATAIFAVALRQAGWFGKDSSRVYIVIGLTAFLVVALYGFYPDAVIANGFPFYPFMIPAIPFVLPFYMGVNLLRRAGVS